MANKLPTNSDILGEIKEVKKEVKEVKAIVMTHDMDIKTIQLRNARIDGREEYVATHPNGGNVSQKDLLKFFGKLSAGLIALLATAFTIIQIVLQQ